MRAIAFALCFLLVTSIPALSSGHLAALKGDETGMVPGDIVLGNIKSFPGHAGIYIGKWDALPKDLQDRFASVYDNTLIRSRQLGLKRSFLIVDSDGGRGARLASFAEQFTNYMIKGTGAPKLRGALTWEARTGRAIQWPSLAVDDPRRWEIVAEALKAAAAKVPYDDGHLQWQTTGTGTSYASISEWSGKVKTIRRTPYSEMDGLDCIALVHLAYWRGANIDLDVSWFPVHTPEQIDTYAQENNLTRAVLFEPIWREAALFGAWQISGRIVESSWKKGESFLPEKFDVPVWVELRDLRPFFRIIDLATGNLKEGKPTETEVNVQRDANDVLFIEENKPNNEARIEIPEHGLLKGVFKGIDDAGPYRIEITGTRIKDIEPAN